MRKIFVVSHHQRKFFHIEFFPNYGSYTMAILKWPTRKKLASEVMKCFQNLKNTLECTDRLMCILVNSCYNLEYACEEF